MHIPDGYLSPSTCAVLYGTAIPFWYAAFARVKRLLNTRLVPLLAVASAFCFVIMMFNVPLPGGTTGHAVGVGAATVVLGPWASMLSVSIALLIQAVFFGDGGITTLRRELLQHGDCRARWWRILSTALVAGRTAITSSRRVVAAALAGYAAINVSAFLTACELGIQPLFFKDASGAPLYAPYAAAHRDSGDDDRASYFCRIGGTVCVGRSGGISAAHESCAAGAEFCGWRCTKDALRPAEASGWRTDRAALDSSGSAHASDASRNSCGGHGLGRMERERFFRSRDAAENCGSLGQRRASVRNSREGLARLSSLWSAPFPQYAPPFVRHPAFGYVMSAMFGSGLILGFFLLMGWMFGRRDGRCRQDFTMTAPEDREE